MNLKDIVSQKNDIRNKILSERDLLDKDVAEEKSAVIIEKLCKIIDKKGYNNIMIFMDMNNEVKATKLLNIYKNKNFYIPKVLKKSNMKINKYNEEELILHKFGYYESLSEDYIDEIILDLIVMPGIAFDTNKNRIGFGGGYYDKFLYNLKKRHKKRGSKPPLTAAICYDFQIIKKIYAETHDIKPDIVISENRIISHHSD